MRLKAGMKFGRLTAVDLVDAPGRARWKFICSCGEEKVIGACSVLAGETISCGCRAKETLALGRSLKKTHGMSGSLIYLSYYAMRSRCEDPKNKSFPRYGGRGIFVCDRWKNSFEAFIADMGLRPSCNHSLERVDNNKEYSPENVIWAKKEEQARNRRSSRIFIWDGVSTTLPDLCRRFEVNYKTAHGRIQRGWSLAEALDFHPDNDPRSPSRPGAEPGAAGQAGIDRNREA